MSDLSTTPRRLPSPCLGIATLAAVAAGVAAAPHAVAAKTKIRTLSASGELVRTARPTAHSTVQTGTLRGKPFRSGRMVLRSSLRQATVTSTFTLTTPAGLVRGRATARLTLDGDTATYRGTARITSGTRRYRGAAGSNIRFTGVGPVSAKRTKITLSGRVRY
ncbi:MAG: hypothetical protein Q8K79_04360 [Solirubrobacteraceae bacterium]|nr:hypothetical protein [Solirubrobacteraceae bacterium]